MRSILVAAMSALLVSLLCTPAVVRLFRRRGYGQEIREDGPSSHATKRGTPTMGGAVIIGATLIGYAVAHLLVLGQPGAGPPASGLPVLARGAHPATGSKDGPGALGVTVSCGGVVVRPGDVVVARPWTRPELLVVKRAVAPVAGGWQVASDNPAVAGQGWTGGEADVLARLSRTPVLGGGVPVGELRPAEALPPS